MKTKTLLKMSVLLAAALSCRPGNALPDTAFSADPTPSTDPTTISDEVSVLFNIADGELLLDGTYTAPTFRLSTDTDGVNMTFVWNIETPRGKEGNDRSEDFWKTHDADISDILRGLCREVGRYRITGVIYDTDEGSSRSYGKVDKELYITGGALPESMDFMVASGGSESVFGLSSFEVGATGDFLVKYVPSRSSLTVSVQSDNPDVFAVYPGRAVIEDGRISIPFEAVAEGTANLSVSVSNYKETVTKTPSVTVVPSTYKDDKTYTFLPVEGWEISSNGPVVAYGGEALLCRHLEARDHYAVVRIQSPEGEDLSADEVLSLYHDPHGWKLSRDSEALLRDEGITVTVDKRTACYVGMHGKEPQPWMIFTDDTFQDWLSTIGSAAAHYYPAGNPATVITFAETASFALAKKISVKLETAGGAPLSEVVIGYDTQQQRR